MHFLSPKTAQQSPELSSVIHNEEDNSRTAAVLNESRAYTLMNVMQQLITETGHISAQNPEELQVHCQHASSANSQS